jgi:hypothetical protein
MVFFPVRGLVAQAAAIPPIIIAAPINTIDLFMVQPPIRYGRIIGKGR